MDRSYVESIPPELLASTPAGVPPPGVEPNFVNPPSDGHVFYIVSTIVLMFMFTFAGLRYYTKFFVRRKRSLDDWTTLAAIVATVLYFIAGVLAIERGRYGTHAWDVSMAQVMSNDMIVTGYFSNWFASVPRALAKTSFFVMYLELFKPFRWLCWFTWAGLATNICFYTAAIITKLYLTSPAPGESWQDSFMAPRFKLATSAALPIAIGGLIIDIWILIIPIMAVGKLKLSLKKKFGLVLVFTTGSVACVASAMSIYYGDQLRVHAEDFTFHVLPVILMAFVEMCVGIACSCMPACAYFIRSKRSKTTGRDTPSSSYPSTSSTSSSSIKRLVKKLRTPFTSTTNSESHQTGKSQESWTLSDRKTPDADSKLSSTSSEHELWEGKNYNARTTSQAETWSQDIEEGHIYIERSFQAVSQENKDVV